MYPILNTLAISFSSKDAVNAGQVGIIPVGFQLDAYRYVLEDEKFFTSFKIAVIRLISRFRQLGRDKSQRNA